MDRDQMKSVYVGPIATVPTPFDDDYEVDYGRMADATKWWVDNGLVKGRTVLKVGAALGEGPQLRDHELFSLFRTVVQASDGKANVVGCIHYKDTVRAIEDAKKAQDLGVVGLQISPPIWNGPNVEDILRHFEAISNAIDIGILLYCRVGMAAAGELAVPEFKRMMDFEKLVAIKWGPPPGVEYEAIYELADHYTIIDNRRNPIVNHQLGGRGWIQNTVDAYPPHDFKIWDLMEDGEYDEAEALYKSVMLDKLWPYYVKISQNSGGQPRMKKGFAELLGMSMGSCRPPSLPLSPDEKAELRDILVSVGWPVVG